eukprot:UN00132
MAQRDTIEGEEELESKTLKAIVKVLAKLANYDAPSKGYSYQWSPEHLVVFEAVCDAIADIANDDETFQQVVTKTSTIVTAKAQGTYAISEKKVKQIQKAEKVFKKVAKENQIAKKQAKANYKETKLQQKSNKNNNVKIYIYFYIYIYNNKYC